MLRTDSRRRVAAGILTTSIAALACTSSPALAAAKEGSYKGSSSGKIEVRVADPVLGSAFKKQTDTGKVSFRVKGSAVKSFSIKGQKLMCGGQPMEVDFKIASITLSSKGSGTGTYTSPELGGMKVTIKVTAKGAATGTVKPTGLCATSATFKATRS